MNNPLSSRRPYPISRHLSCAILITILLTSISSTLVFPLQANAQGLNITTSADGHGRAFFGEAALQVIIDDPDADDDDLQETITVDIDADPDVGPAASASFTIFETSESSGRFEFFLMHNDADDVSVAELDANNTNGAEEHDATSFPPDAEASVIRFGTGEELPLTSSLFEDVSFDITVDNEEITVDYEETTSALELDKSTYGSDSLVYIFVIDQDGNLNPTEPDSFDVTAVELNSLLFDIDGASFEGAVSFEETGENTARFEGVVQLSDVETLSDSELVFTNEAVQMTLNDIADYMPPTDVTASVDTSSRSFDINDEDGELDTIGIVTFASELEISVRDNDRNRDSGDDETLDDVVTVAVDAVGGDLEFLDMQETGDNTGAFIIDLANNELAITFLDDGEMPNIDNDRLELRQIDITKDIIVEYDDIRDDDSLNSVTSSQTFVITLASATINLPTSTGVGEDFILTLIEPDLNDNPRTKDSYTFVLNSGIPFNLTRGGDSMGLLASLEFELNGVPIDFEPQEVAYTLVEDDINSGVFAAEMDMGDIADFGNDGGPLDIKNGDVLKATYNDLMSDVAQESTDQMTIGKADVPDEDEACFDLKATIVGTEHDDILNGTSGDDVIVGLRGNDVINGLGGNDIICGGLGLDDLSGGEGNDQIFGGNGNDVINGNSGFDSLWGGQGWDKLFGGLGRDLLFGGVGNDSLEGGDGNDKLFGQAGTDRLDGGAGDNLLVQD